MCGFVSLCFAHTSSASAVVQRRQLMARALCTAIDTRWGKCFCTLQSVVQWCNTGICCEIVVVLNLSCDRCSLQFNENFIFKLCFLPKVRFRVVAFVKPRRSLNLTKLFIIPEIIGEIIGELSR